MTTKTQSKPLETFTARGLKIALKQLQGKANWWCELWNHHSVTVSIYNDRILFQGSNPRAKHSLLLASTTFDRAEEHLRGFVCNQPKHY